MYLEKLTPAAITVAPNGGRRIKADHPQIPMTAPELAACAAQCLDAGAAMIHLHVRDREGRHVLDLEAYKQALAAIEREVGDRLIVQITTESLGLYQPEQQIALVKTLRPEAASLALRELVPNQGHEANFVQLLEWMYHKRVLPQIILYEPGEALHLEALCQRAQIPSGTIPVLFVLGRYRPGQRSTPQDLRPFLTEAAGRFRHWSVCAFGQHEAACVVSAALMGGHMRVGFENNLYLTDGTIAADNAALVRQLSAMLQALNVPRLDAEGARQLWWGDHHDTAGRTASHART